MPVRYSLLSVWVRLSIFSQLSIIQSIIQYVGLCVFSLPTPLVMIERIYILCLIIIIKLEVWTITRCLGLGHKTMVCAVCLSIFLWSFEVAMSWAVIWYLKYFPQLMWQNQFDITEHYILCELLTVNKSHSMFPQQSITGAQLSLDWLFMTVCCDHTNEVWWINGMLG